MRDDDDDTDRPQLLPPASGFDDGVLTRGDLERPIGGYPLTDEEDREQILKVYSGEGGDAAKEFEAHLEQWGETGLDPPPRTKRRFFR